MRFPFLFRELTPEQIALAQQAELLRRERKMAKELRGAYAVASKALAAEINYFVRKLREAADAGEVPAEWWLYERGRLDSLMLQWQAWAEETSTKNAKIVDLARLDVVNMGAAHARAMATAVGTSFNALPKQAILAILESTMDGRPLQERFLRAGADAAVQARNAIVESLTLGENPRLLGRKLTRILKTSKINGQVIARSEVLRAYRQATIETYKINADVATGWRWLATMDSRVCPICLAMHGTEHKLSEPFISHAACRCTQVPIVEDVDYGSTGQELFNKMPFSGKAEIFGPVKAALITEFDIPLRELIYFQDNKWGGTLKELSLEQMVQKGLITREQLAGAALKKAA